MTTYVRKLHERATAGDMKEDRWKLVFDSDAKRLYVVHFWSHANQWKPSKSSHGSKQMDINEFLATGDPLARAEMSRLLECLFEKDGSENSN